MKNRIRNSDYWASIVIEAYWCCVSIQILDGKFQWLWRNERRDSVEDGCQYTEVFNSDYIDNHTINMEN